MLMQVVCPMCGGIVEAEEDAELIRLARLHTRRIHDYEVPEDHVRRSIEPVDED